MRGDGASEMVMGIVPSSARDVGAPVERGIISASPRAADGD